METQPDVAVDPSSTTHPTAASLAQQSPSHPVSDCGVPLDDVYFYNPSHFPHLDILTRNRAVIVKELTQALCSPIVPPSHENGAQLSGVWCEDDAFDAFYNRTKNEEGWLHWWSVNNPHKPNNDWTIFGLLHGGKYMTKNCKKCPETTKLLEQVPGLRVAGFSRMQPRSGIETHKGFTGKRYGALAYHLGLVIPPTGATLHCGPHVHEWRKGGDVIVFDDTYPHSAWNKSDQERIILYIDFKIPPPLLSQWNTIPVILDSDSDDSDDDDDDTPMEPLPRTPSMLNGPLTLPPPGPERDAFMTQLNPMQLLTLLIRGSNAKKAADEAASKAAPGTDTNEDSNNDSNKEN